MKDLLLHPATRQALEAFVAQPSHALLLAAPTGSGKATVAQALAGALLGIRPGKLPGYPYYKLVASPEGKAISIEAVRDAIHFTTLRTPGTNVLGVGRVVLFQDAHLLTTQAQNALLKVIEEPPAGTIMILATSSVQAILPTIRSRAQCIALQLPHNEEITAYFTKRGYPPDAVRKALLMSGGLPGLMHALLETNADHPLVAAASIARDILQKPTFERLLLAEELAKQRQLWLDVLFILGKMAAIALQQNGSNRAAAGRWQKILAASHEAEKQTLQSGQLKLVTLNFMLTL